MLDNNGFFNSEKIVKFTRICLIRDKKIVNPNI